jgi:hypothetical protein
MEGNKIIISNDLLFDEGASSNTSTSRDRELELHFD